MKICEAERCTGCCACMNICPKDAIEMIVDRLGKTVPSVDSVKCVMCGLCLTVCPENHPPKKKVPIRTYAVWSENDIDKLFSSSGGVSASFVRRTIEGDGIAFGAACENGLVKHIGVEEEREAEKLRGSKYVQSYIGKSYNEAKELLLSGKRVLYTGTPCQIAGLKNYLGREYDNLITIDLICHGVPPMDYLSNYIHCILKGKSYTRFSFRGKYDWNFTIFNGERIIYKKPAKYDIYFQSFLKCLTYRDNCYKCPYSCKERVSDITIGDFWGLRKETLKKQYNGRISVVLLNTEKALSYFENNSEELYYEERTLDEAVNEFQENLIRPSKPHPERSCFLRTMEKGSFYKGIKKTRLARETNRVFWIDRLKNIKRIFDHSRK